MRPSKENAVSEDESSSSDEALRSTSGLESEFAGTLGTSRKQVHHTETEWKKGSNFSPSAFSFDASTSGQPGSNVLPRDTQKADCFELFWMRI